MGLYLFSRKEKKPKEHLQQKEINAYKILTLLVQVNYENYKEKYNQIKKINTTYFCLESQREIYSKLTKLEAESLLDKVKKYDGIAFKSPTISNYVSNIVNSLSINKKVA